MPGVSGRMSTMVKAKVSALLDRAEDPAETLDYSYEKQLEQLQSVKRGITDLVTATKRLQMQEATAQQQIAKLDEQARQAMAAGRDLARTALERKHLADGEIQSLDQQIAQLEDQRQKLTDSEESCASRSTRSAPEGSYQGAVLGRRGAGADLRGRDRRRRGDGRRRAGDAARAG